MRTTKDFLGSQGLNRFVDEGTPRVTLVGDDFKNLTQTSSSFKNDPPGSPLKSTQQIPLDWSKFENHTCFSSAEVNVNVAFNNIINGYPFDGTSEEINYFLDELTGYEKWIYDQFPKNIGTLHFSNSYITVNDVPGAEYKEMSRNLDGKSVLDPKNDSISFQFNGYFEKLINDNQVIFQRIYGQSGYTLAISQSLSIDDCTLVFMVSSGSSYMSASCSIEKGKWIDIATNFNRKSFYNKLFIYIDGQQYATSSTSQEFSDFSLFGSRLTIGSGSTHQLVGTSFVPQQNLSASLDNFRIFHGTRTQDQIIKDSTSFLYPQDNLKLFFKFNEPSGSYQQKSLVIDSSTNGLHSNIINYSNFLRSNPNGLPKMREKIYENPVLFPDYAPLFSLNQKLLASASYYDEINPNLITKLVPPHYFYEGRLEAGFETDEGPISTTYAEDGNIPGQVKLGSSQILSGLLYIWAKQFDEIKVFLDHFSKIESYEYEKNSSLANQFLIKQAKNIGIELPQLFTTLKPSDEDSGDDFGISLNSNNSYSLQEIQYDIWRRLIASMPGIIKSKGTITSIKELIRAFGVNPDTSIRVREYGGAKEGILETRRMRRVSAGKLLPLENYEIVSPFLSGSRIEPGYPLPSGNISEEGSDNPSDGLMTSGSWTYEATYRFPENLNFGNQSLVRFYTTGSNGEALVFNLITKKSGTLNDGSSTLTLYGCTDNITQNQFSISIDDKSIFDGDRWHISFGRQRKNSLESMFFLRAGKQVSGQISSLTEKTLFITHSNDILSSLSVSDNTSGSYFRIGNYNSHNSNNLLDVTSLSDAAYGNFSGEISSIRFYSKFLSDSEWYEHIQNHESFGVKNPLINYNFKLKESGSFERLRLEVPVDQENLFTDSYGNISFFDYSQNELHLSGSFFDPLTQVIGSDDIIFSSLDPKFDERTTDNKVRIRSFNDFELAKINNADIAPVYEVPRYEEPFDDVRFGIEISTVQSLNEDIIKMFSDFSSIDYALGDPANAFESEYIDLEDLRDVYFKRLDGIPQYSNVVLFSKWFESALGKLIEQFIPSNTKFLGINLVVENHMLERSKMKYNWGEVYLGENNRRNLRGTIKLAQLVANVRR